jgi:hypothetical protein
MTLPEIQDPVSKLSTEELPAFRDWFWNFNAEAWDRQFEQDALSGALDTAIGGEVRRAWQDGRCLPL